MSIPSVFFKSLLRFVGGRCLNIHKRERFPPNHGRQVPPQRSLEKRVLPIGPIAADPIKGGGKKLLRRSKPLRRCSEKRMNPQNGAVRRSRDAGNRVTISPQFRDSSVPSA